VVTMEMVVMVMTMIPEGSWHTGSPSFMHFHPLMIKP
jgi:hypothetical protein